MYRLGILGNCCTHGVGAVNALKARQEVQLIAGYEANPRRAVELEAALGFQLARSFEEVIGHPGIDIVVIAADPCEKAHLVEKACLAGKHIFLNKPFSHTLADARRLAKAVASSKVKLVFDIPMVKFLPALGRLKAEVRAGKYGKLISYYHAFGMTFAPDFPIRQLWPERFDPPAKAGGGEMTNMGCYAIDFAVTLLGLPRTVQAKWMKFWQEYREAEVENFGQIILDYGSFYALLAVGKQQLATEPRRGNNHLSLLFETANLFIDPYSETLLVNGVPGDFQQFLSGCPAESAFEQLLRCIETGAEPESNAELGALGVEVTLAAYHSICQDGQVVSLPLKDGRNPLFGGSG